MFRGLDQFVECQPKLICFYEFITSPVPNLKYICQIVMIDITG